MNRRECLDAAADCVLRNRQAHYDTPERNFERIATIWSVIFGHPVEPAQVALAMAAVKLARLAGNLGHVDSWVDLAGYAACGAEVATEDAPCG